MLPKITVKQTLKVRFTIFLFKIFLIEMFFIIMFLE